MCLNDNNKSFAGERDKITLLQEVEKRPEQGVYITKKRCAELDGAARLRLNFCNYHFRTAKPPFRRTGRRSERWRTAKPPFTVRDDIQSAGVRPNRLSPYGKTFLADLRKHIQLGKLSGLLVGACRGGLRTKNGLGRKWRVFSPNWYNICAMRARCEYKN